MTEAVAPWEMEWGKPDASADKNPWEMDWNAGPAHPAEQPGALADVGRAALVGPAKGVTGLFGLPGDLGALRDAGIEKIHRLAMRIAGHTPDEIEESVKSFKDALDLFKPKHDLFPTSEKIQGAIDQKLAPAGGTLFPEAQTEPGKVVQNVGEFIPAALAAGGEGVIANLLKGAVAPGVASEVAGHALEGTPLETPARVAGGVAGGGVAHAADIGTSALKTHGAARQAAGEASSVAGGAPITAGAISRLGKDVANDQLTPQIAADRMRELGPEGMLIDAGRQLQGRAEAIATQPGKGQNAILDAVEGRTGKFGAGTAARTKGTLNTTMGASPDVVATQKQIADFVDKRAKPLYDSVMNGHPVVNVPADITNRPSVAQAMKDAVSLAKDYGEKLSQPIQQTVLNAGGAPVTKTIQQPAQTSLRYWDYVKKAMDSRINGLMRKGGMEALDSAEKADLGGMISARNALRDHLDQVTGGDYKTARSVAAEKPQLNEALQIGRDALNTKLLPEELADVHDNMSIPQQGMLRAGMRREVERIIDTARNDGAAARRILDTNQNREKIADMFGQRAADAIDARIAAETKFQEATNKISANSRTGVRQQLVKDTESPSAATPPMASTMGYVHKGVANVLGNLRQTGMENTRNSIGALMTTPAAKVPDLVRILANYNARAAANAAPAVTPYAGTLARVLGLNAISRGAASGDQQQRAP